MKTDTPPRQILFENVKAGPVPGGDPKKWRVGVDMRGFFQYYRQQFWDSGVPEGKEWAIACVVNVTGIRPELALLALDGKATAMTEEGVTLYLTESESKGPIMVSSEERDRIYEKALKGLRKAQKEGRL